MYMNVGSSVSQEFQLTTGCTCPGDSIVYLCTAIGDGFTHYGGTAFNCPLLRNEVILPHIDYSTGTVTMSCSYISARSLGVSNSQYKSQLTISNISQELNGRSVNCSYSTGATTSAMVIGLLPIQITRGIRYYNNNDPLN